jgi:hypothetical protein
MCIYCQTREKGIEEAGEEFKKATDSEAENPVKPNDDKAQP